MSDVVFPSPFGLLAHPAVSERRWASSLCTAQADSSVWLFWWSETKMSHWWLYLENIVSHVTFRSKLAFHMAESIKEVYKSLNKNVRSTTFRLCKHCSYFVINICDVHTVEDVIFEIILQYSPEYVKRYVGPERTRTLNPHEIQRTNTSKMLHASWMENFLFFLNIFAFIKPYPNTIVQSALWFGLQPHMHKLTNP